MTRRTAFDGHSRIVFLSLAAALLLFVWPSATDARVIPESLEFPHGILIEPRWTAQVRSYYYGSDPLRASYCLEYSEGDCLREGENIFLDVGSTVVVNRLLVLQYNGQVREPFDGRDSHPDYRTKKAFAILRTGIVSWEFGKDSVRIGHGAHGSLLLSDNAESGLTFIFRTEAPVRLPWILSRIGSFDYLLFHTWYEDIRLFGHRLEYRPFGILEFGLNQTVFYNERFAFYEFPRVLGARDENAPGRFDNDQRASADVALYLPFLGRILPGWNGKAYFEFAGEDLKAFWQKPRDHFQWPVGVALLDPGMMGGLFFTSGSTDLRIEYAENHTGETTWYGKFPFTNHGVLMGHHMGRDADDLFVEVARRWSAWGREGDIRISVDRERHGVSQFGSDAEVRSQFSFIPAVRCGPLRLFAQLIYARYTNVDRNPDPLAFDIVPGTHRNEYTVGLGITVR